MSILDAVTLLMSRGSPVNKQFTLHEDGSVTKKMAPNNGFFAAQTKSAANLDEMVGHLHALAADASLTLSLGVFKDAPDQLDTSKNRIFGVIEAR